LSSPGPGAQTHHFPSLRLWALLAIAAVAVIGLVYGANHGGRRTPQDTSARPAPPERPAAAPRPAVAQTLVARPAGRLADPVQAPAAAPLQDGRVLLMGGLDAASASSSGIGLAGVGRPRAVGQLPAAVHDAAAAPAPGGAYLFGGGEPSQDAILRVSTSGRTSREGRLPAPASDVAAATVQGRYYVVGGYTGVQPLNTIVEWRPGEAKGRVAARLPVAVRYAAVAAAGREVVIAGGSVGIRASRAVYAFDPARRSVRRLARLPHPLTHASAATLGGIVYVVGGRGANLDSQTRRILAIDPRTGRVTDAGLLPRGLSDAGVTAVRGNRIVVAGGRDAAGRASDGVLTLAPR
jgi:N-acetylneuraminic acid mutarotase